MTFVTLTLGVALVLAIGCSFAFIGVALQARSAPDLVADEALLDAFLFAVASAQACVEFLGFSAMLTPGLALLCGAAGSVIAARRVPEAASVCRAHARAIGRALRRSPFLWVLCAYGIVIACHGLARVPLPWDALTYHLTYVAVWIQHHAFAPFGAGGVWEQYESFPKAGETLSWLAMAPFHGDALVSLVNLPFWFAIALSFRCAARRLGVAPAHADAWCLPLLLHPMLAAYVTPPYVEVQTTFYLLAAVACALRARSDLRALSGLLLATCMAIATKVTALSWLPLLGLWLLVLAKMERVRPVLRGTLNSGTVLGLLVALPWYVDNTIRCDNPLYPAALPLMTSGPAAGSLAMARTLSSSSIVGIGNYGELFDLLLTPPWRGHYPLGPGMLFVWLWLATPLGIACIRSAPARRQALGLWACAWFLFIVYLLTPHNGFFIDANSRFLLGPCVLCALAISASDGGRAPRLRGALLLITYALTLLAEWPSQLWRFAVWAPFATHPAAWVVAGFGFALLASALFQTSSTAIRALRAGLLSALAVSILVTLEQREQHRYDDLEHGVDLHPIAVDSTLWRRLASLGPSRVAFAVGGYHSLEGWFFYPLFGPRLRNHVQYVDIERDAAPACRRRGMVRDEPDEHAWLERLKQQRITHLYLMGGPLESTWARAHPDRFKLLAQHREAELYQVTRPSRSPADASMAGPRP